MRFPKTLAQSDALGFQLPPCTPSNGWPSESLSQEGDSGVPHSTKRIEIEILTLIKAGPPKAEVRSAERDGTEAGTVPDASRSQAEAGPAVFQDCGLT